LADTGTLLLKLLDQALAFCLSTSQSGRIREIVMIRMPNQLYYCSSPGAMPRLATPMARRKLILTRVQSVGVLSFFAT